MTLWRKSMAVIAGSLLLGVGLGACRGDQPTPVVPEELERFGADQVIYGMKHNITVDGVRQARVEADTSFGWRDSTAVALRNPTLTVYHEDGREKAVVTSREGRLDESDHLIATGDVVLVVPEDERRIESEELNYDPQGDRIWSPTDFAMWVAGRERPIRGTSFESDLAFRNFRMTGEGDEAPDEGETDDGDGGAPNGGG